MLDFNPHGFYCQVGDQMRITKDEILDQWKDWQDEINPSNFTGFYRSKIPAYRILILCSSSMDLLNSLNDFIDFKFENKSEKFKEKLYFKNTDEVYKLQKDEFNR